MRELYVFSDNLKAQFGDDFDLWNEFHLTFIALTPKLNRVTVFLDECTESNIAKLKQNISDSEMIWFEKMSFESSWDIITDSIETNTRLSSTEIPMGSKNEYPHFARLLPYK